MYLTDPICTCDSQDLAWTVCNYDEGTKCRLIISCLNCKTKLEIPHEKFLGGFKIEKEYPKGILQKNYSEPETSDQKFLKDLGIVPDF